MTEIRVIADPTDYIHAAAAEIVRIGREAIEARDIFTISLSGGGTPKKVYALLAEEPYTSQLDWSKTHVFWSDDRCVPATDPESNYWLAYDAFLSKVPIPAENVHRMPADAVDREAAARMHEEELRAFFGNGTEPVFDLHQLGMGPDGHTASLFPHQASLEEKTRWVLFVTVSKPPPPRLTFTFPVINAARYVLYLVAGAEKAPAVYEVLQGEPNPDLYPTQRVQLPNGKLIWLLDEAAAANLKR